MRFFFTAKKVVVILTVVAPTSKTPKPRPSIAFPLIPNGFTFKGGYLLNVVGLVAVAVVTVKNVYLY